MSAQIPSGFNIAELINTLIKEMPSEDPLKYLGNMYDSVNPAFINFAVSKAKEKAAELNNKKGTKECQIFFEMGQENISRAKISSFFSGLLFIEDYVRSKGPTLGITPTEIKTFTDVMRRVGLPTLTDAYTQDGPVYSTKTYDAVLSAWLLWMSRASIVNRQGSEATRSNREVCDVLTSSALASYPGVPFTAYHIANIKTNEDIPTIAEKLYKGTKFDKFISDEFAAINEPKFVALTANAPVAAIAVHPLVFNATGLVDANSNTVEWFSGFTQNAEFTKLCMKNNLTPKQVAVYMLSTSLEHHQRNIEAKHPVATFINEQGITRAVYEQLRKSDGLIKLGGSVEKNYLG